MQELNFANIPKESLGVHAMFLVLKMMQQPKSDPKWPRVGHPKPNTLLTTGVEDHVTHHTFPTTLHKLWAQHNIPSYQKRTRDSPIFSGEEN
jgi:hypothetical protein